MKHLLGLLRSRKNIQGASLVLAELFYHGFAKQEEILIENEALIKYLGVDCTPQWIASKLKVLEDVKYISRLKKNGKTVVRRGQNFKDLCGGSVVDSLSEQPKTVKKTDEDKKKEMISRKIEFIRSVNAFKDKFDKIVLEDFIGYWTEPNMTTFKMKFENEKTFGIGRRLSTLNSQDWMKQKVNRKNNPIQKTWKV